MPSYLVNIVVTGSETGAYALAHALADAATEQAGLSAADSEPLTTWISDPVQITQGEQ